MAMPTINELVADIKSGQLEINPKPTSNSIKSDVLVYLQMLKEMQDDASNGKLIQIKDEDSRTMDEAIAVYGEEYQIDRFIEEVNELTKALLKRRRTDLPSKRFDKLKINDNVQEEIGDVLITLAQVIKIHGDPDAIRRSMERKINRLAEQLRTQNPLT